MNGARWDTPDLIAAPSRAAPPERHINDCAATPVTSGWAIFVSTSEAISMSIDRQLVLEAEAPAVSEEKLDSVAIQYAEQQNRLAYPIGRRYTPYG